jgi:transposase
MSKNELHPADQRVLAPDGVLRLVESGNRHQVQMIVGCLDDQLPEDHRARVVDDVVGGMDVSSFYREIESRAGVGGRPAHDPRVLLSLWLLAVLDGYGSAREVSRLVDEHVAYRWLAHGVSISYHTLSSFRVEHAERVDRLLTQLVAALVSEGLVPVEQVAQDGMRVRANAGAASFHRQPTLAEALVAAEARVQALAREPEGATARQRAARERGARERVARLQKALITAAELDAQRGSTDDPARVSSTDPEARVMKHGDGGFRPSYNVNLATDVASQVILGVAVTNSGSDLGQAAPMHQKVVETTGKTPAEYLVDGGYTKHDDIDTIEAAGSRVIAPVPKPKDKARNPHQPRPNDSPAVAAWRQRMGEAATKALYHLRAATAECVNALMRNRGLRAFMTRGLKHATTCATWHALAHNLMRAAILRAPAMA